MTKWTDVKYSPDFVAHMKRKKYDSPTQKISNIGKKTILEQNFQLMDILTVKFQILAAVWVLIVPLFGVQTKNTTC